MFSSTFSSRVLCATGMSQPSLNWQHDLFAWASEPNNINDLWSYASQPKLRDIPMPRVKKRVPPDEKTEYQRIRMSVEYRIPKARQVPWPPMSWNCSKTSFRS